MSFVRTLRKVVAFFRRDFAIARGYRGAFLIEILEAFFGVATFYYLSRFVQSPELSSALPAGSSYFAFALVGFAFFDYLSVSLTAFDASIEEARQNRTLEALLSGELSEERYAPATRDSRGVRGVPVCRTGHAHLRVFRVGNFVF